MDQVVLLSLPDAGRAAEGDGCAGPRVPVLACRDALRAAGARVELVAAGSDAEVDGVLTGLPEARVIVAAAAVGQVRAVLRRLVRRYAVRAGARPDDLPADRTVVDLPPLGILPLAPLGRWLPVPERPEEVAAAVLAGRTRRMDLLRTDAGSVTVDGALFGGADADGRPVPFAARVEVDDTVLTEGDEPLLAVVVANAEGYAELDGLPLVTGPDPADGVVDVAVALPPARSGLLPGLRRPTVEVRRARGRAVAVLPRDDVRLVDDGVPGVLTRRRTWWMERSAWSVYAG